MNSTHGLVAVGGITFGDAVTEILTDQLHMTTKLADAWVVVGATLITLIIAGYKLWIGAKTNA